MCVIFKFLTSLAPNAQIKKKKTFNLICVVDDRGKSLLGESHAPRVSYLTLHHSCVLKIFLKCNRVTKS